MWPTPQPPILQCSLQLIIHHLTRLHFQPLATIHYKFLSFKTLFLVAVTSARQASELAALRADPPYLQFHLGKATLYPDVSFLPKVVSDFHLTQPIVLPTFFPSPSSALEQLLHNFDIKRSLAFYISHTKDF